MEIEVKKLPKSETILIPVAEESLTEFASDITSIVCEGKRYKVFDFFKNCL